MGERLAGGNVAIVLLTNSLAPGGALVCLIGAFGPISGAHFNPAVTIGEALLGGIRWSEVPVYIAAQIGGANAGVSIAKAMFGLPVGFASHHARGGAGLFPGGCGATFGLLAVIFGCARSRSALVPFAVASYVVAAYCVPLFIGAQLLGATSATIFFGWLARPEVSSA